MCILPKGKKNYAKSNHNYHDYSTIWDVHLYFTCEIFVSLQYAMMYAAATWISFKIPLPWLIRQMSSFIFFYHLLFPCFTTSQIANFIILECFKFYCAHLGAFPFCVTDTNTIELNGYFLTWEPVNPHPVIIITCQATFHFLTFTFRFVYKIRQG